jgi:hypothetical protein
MGQKGNPGKDGLSGLTGPAGEYQNTKQQRPWTAEVLWEQERHHAVALSTNRRVVNKRPAALSCIITVRLQFSHLSF